MYILNIRSISSSYVFDLQKKLINQHPVNKVPPSQNIQLNKKYKTTSATMIIPNIIKHLQEKHQKSDLLIILFKLQEFLSNSFPNCIIYYDYESREVARFSPSFAFYKF